MKIMTCREMGGSCDTKITGNTAKKMMENGSIHIKNMSIMGDIKHQENLKMMEDGLKNPDLSKKWNEEFMRKFNNLPDN
jgi:hypothetical protein